MGIFDFLRPPEKRPPTQEEVKAFTKGYKAERLKQLRRQGREAAKHETEKKQQRPAFFFGGVEGGMEAERNIVARMHDDHRERMAGIPRSPYDIFRGERERKRR